MPGRPDFSQPGSQGSGQKVSVTERPELKLLDYYTTTSLASGSSERWEVYAPTGSVYRVLTAFIFAHDPAGSGATTGSHSAQIRSMDSLGVLYGQSNYNTNLKYDRLTWQTADLADQPKTEAGAAEAERSLRATENNPFVVKYTNDSDVATTEQRDFRIIAEEVSY